MFEYPFELKVYVSRRPWMRDPSLEMELYMGMGILQNLFDDEKVDTETTSIFLSFPERWCNIIEERSIFKRIVRLYPNIKSVKIKTQSVYIIQCTPAGNCFIVEHEDYVNKKLPQESDVGRLWHPNVGLQFDMNKLNVIGGK